MKNLLTVLLCLVAAACSGLSARQEALLPAMRLAWTGGVEADVARGIEESSLSNRLEPLAVEVQRLAVVRIGEGLASGDQTTLASAAWSPLAESATFGIDRRIQLNEISEGVAGSLRERLRNFGDGLTVFLERR